MTDAVFYARGLLICLAAWLPLLHPAVAAGAALTQFWQLGLLLPLALLLGRWGPDWPRPRGWRLDGAAALLALAGTWLVEGSAAAALESLALPAALWALTFLAFRRGLYRVLYLEALAALYFVWRLANLGRASADLEIAARPVILVAAGFGLAAWALWAVAVFRLDAAAAAVPAASFPGASGRGGRGGRGYGPLAAAVGLGLAAFLAALWFFPDSLADFAEDFGPAPRRVDSPGKPADEGLNGISAETGSTEPDNADKYGPSLYEADDGNWASDSKDGPKGDQDKKYLLMVVETEAEAVYLAESYAERLDPALGFTADPANPFNALATTPYLETWEYADPPYDLFRRPVDLNVYSALKVKPTAWVPLRIEPTERTSADFPLQYHYRAVCLASYCNLGGFIPFARPLSPERRQSLASCLETPLDPAVAAPFRAFLDEVLAGAASDSERIDRILRSLEICTYQVSGADEVTVQDMADFLFSTRIGDCSEFAAAAALLGRLAGIPSRVATGFAANKRLRTDTDRRAVQLIRQRFPPLADADPDDLLLISTAEVHAWPQFYLADAGWVDFEATAYSSLPEGAPAGGSNKDLVIPRFEAKSDAARWSPPWRLLAALAGAVLALWAAASQLRYWTTLARLARRAAADTETGAKARYRLFLVGLAARGYPPKRPAETPAEYAAAHPELGTVLALYEAALLHPDGAERAAGRRAFAAAARGFLAARRSPLAAARAALGLGVRSLL